MTDGSCTPKQDLPSTTVNMITIVTCQHRCFLSSGARLALDIHDLCPPREWPLSSRCVVSTDLAEKIEGAGSSPVSRGRVSELMHRLPDFSISLATNRSPRRGKFRERNLRVIGMQSNRWESNENRVFEFYDFRHNAASVLEISDSSRKAPKSPGERGFVSR